MERVSKEVIMVEKKQGTEIELGEGASAPQGIAPLTGNAPQGPLAQGQRWSMARKREVVMRMLRGESVSALSRELGVEIYRLEKWRDKALSGIDGALKEREGDPLQGELDAAMKRIGELTMENELMRMRFDKNRPLVSKRSKR